MCGGPRPAMSLLLPRTTKQLSSGSFRTVRALLRAGHACRAVPCCVVPCEAVPCEAVPCRSNAFLLRASRLAVHNNTFCPLTNCLAVPVLRLTTRHQATTAALRAAEQSDVRVLTLLSPSAHSFFPFCFFKSNQPGQARCLGPTRLTRRSGCVLLGALCVGTLKTCLMSLGLRQAHIWHRAQSTTLSGSGMLSRLQTSKLSLGTKATAKVWCGIL